MKRVTGLTTPALLLSSALLLAGCGSLIPQLEQPKLPVAASLSAAVACGRRQQGRCRSRLAGLLHRSAPETPDRLALDSNRDLRLAVLNIEQARAQLQVRQADKLPTVNAGVNATRAPGTQRADQQLQRRAADQRLRDRFLRPHPQPERSRARPSCWPPGGPQDGADQPDRGGRADPSGCRPTTSCSTVTRQTLATREESLRLTQLKFDDGASSELDLRQAESLLEAARCALAQPSASARSTKMRWCCWSASRCPARLPHACRLSAPTGGPAPSCRPACRPRCWATAPMCARPSSN